MSDNSSPNLPRSFRAVFLSTLLWNTQPHLVVFTLLFLQKGISLSQFFIIQAIGALTAFMLEIPTGVLADRLGRKFSVVGSLALGLVINPLFILSQDIWVLYGASILGGISGALRSGADEALFYDTLKAMQREEEYTKLNGALRWWSGYAGVAASIVGGVVAMFSYALAWWCWEAIVALAFVTSLFIVEPEGVDYKRPPTIFAHLSESLATTFKSQARYYVLYSISVWLFFSVAFWLWQPYLRDIGVGVEFFGVVFALTGVVSGYGSRFVASLEKRCSARAILLLSPSLLAIALACQAGCGSILGALFVLLHSFASGMFIVIADSSIHSRISSSTRATVLSVKNMVSTAVFAVVSPVVGYVADARSLPLALIVLSVGVAFVGALFFLAYPRLEETVSA